MNPSHKEVSTSSKYSRNNCFNYNDNVVYWNGKRSWVTVDFKEIKTVTGVYVVGPSDWNWIHYGPFHLWGEYRCDIRPLTNDEKKKYGLIEVVGIPEKDNNYGKWADRNYNNPNAGKSHDFTDKIDSLYWGGSRLPTVDEARKMKCDSTLNGTNDTWIPVYHPMV